MAMLTSAHFQEVSSRREGRRTITVMVWGRNVRFLVDGPLVPQWGRGPTRPSSRQRRYLFVDAAAGSY